MRVLLIFLFMIVAGACTKVEPVAATSGNDAHGATALSLEESKPTAR